MPLSDSQKLQLADLYDEASRTGDTASMGRIKAALQADRAAAAAPAANPTSDSDFSQNVAEGLGSRMVKMGRAMQQIFSAGADPGVNPETGVSEHPEKQQAELARIQDALKEQNRLDAPLMATVGGKVGDIAGRALPFALAPEGYLGAMAAGAVTGALEPVEAGGQGKVAQIAEGAAGGLIGQGLGAAVGAGIKFGRSQLPLLSDLASQAVQRLKNAGITLSLGQQTGRALAPTAELAAEQGRQLTRAALRQMGVDSPVASTQVMDAGRRVLQNTYDELAANLTVKTTGDAVLMRAISQAEADADSYLTPAVAGVVKKQVRGILDRIQANGSTMNGTLFKNLHDGLDKIADPSATGIVEDLQQAMRAAMTRSSSPADAALLAKTDQQYGAMKAIEKSIGTNGRVDPTKFAAATDTTAGAAASVYGRGPNAPLAELANDAKLIMVDGPAAAGKKGGLLTPEALINYATKRAAFHAVPAAIGGYEGFQHGGAKGALIGIAMGLGGAKLAQAAGSNPAVANALAKFAESNGIRTAQDAAAYMARNLGAQAGGVAGPAMGGMVSGQGEAGQ